VIRKTIIIDRSREHFGFQDVAADRHDEVKKYFIHLAENVTHMLNIVGYELCPAEMVLEVIRYGVNQKKSGRIYYMDT
jgi:hypothetical protein